MEDFEDLFEEKLEKCSNLEIEGGFVVYSNSN